MLKTNFEKADGLGIRSFQLGLNMNENFEFQY
jgi:hypothetical protein